MRGDFRLQNLCACYNVPIMQKGVTIVREVSGYAHHKALPEPFPLYGSANAWWNDVAKVENLFEGVARFKIIKRAIVYAHITLDQYYYFIEIHPHFSEAFETLTLYRHNVLIDKINSAKDWHAAQFQLQTELPAEFGHQGFGDTLPVGGSVATMIQEAFMDKDGKVLMKRSTAQLLEDIQPHGE